MNDDEFVQANKKFLDGNGLTDQELNGLIARYEPLATGLFLLGPHFHLTWHETFTRLRLLQGFRAARDHDGA